MLVLFESIKEVKACTQAAETQIKLITGSDTLVVAFPKFENKLNVYQLLRLVCNTLELPYEKLKQGSRAHMWVDARTIMVYLVKKIYPNINHTELAYMIGCKEDHTMISHYVKRYSNMMETMDSMFLMKYNLVLEAFEQWLAAE